MEMNVMLPPLGHDHVMIGDGANDTLNGNPGSDVLLGGVGNDKSRCWRDGGWVATTAANDAVFDVRSAG